MSVKNFDTSDNKDRQSRREENSGMRESSSVNFPENTKEKETVEVKNAHASGDGSYGRNESNIPEEEPGLSKDDSIY